MIRLPPAAEPPGLLADLTPLLDVIFIVLVFFLLTAQTPLLQVPLRLPDSLDATTAVAGEKERRQLLFLADGAWQLDQLHFADWTALRDAAPLAPDDALDIAVEQGAQADDLLRLLAWLTASGVNDISLLMESSND